MTSKPIVYVAAVVVFALCIYAFLKGNGIFEGKFQDDPLGWYFFAKGIFCAFSLVLTREVLEALRAMRR